MAGAKNDQRDSRMQKLEADEKNGKLIFNLSPADLKKNSELVNSVIHEVVGQQNNS